MSSLEKHIERKKEVNKIIRFRTLLATGAGFIPIPLLDATSILTIQLWMIRDISKVYNIPFEKHVVKSLIGTLLSNISSIGIIKFIPGLGSLLGGGTVAASGAAATYALGKIFTQHFDQGGTLLSFDPLKSQEHFRQLYNEGKVSVKELQKQEVGFNAVSSQVQASTVALQRANEDLKTTIAALQAELEQSKKNRKYALAAIKDEQQDDKYSHWFRWLLLPLVLIVGIGLLYQAGCFSPLKKPEVSSEINEDISKPKQNSQPSISIVESSVIDSAALTSTTDRIQVSSPLDTVALDFPKGSSEAQIANYLSDLTSKFPKTFSLQAIEFDEGRADLSEDARRQLANLATILKVYPRATIRVYGHTDPNSGQAKNRQAGRLRAKAIEVILRQNGIAGKRIKTAFMEKPAPPEWKRGAEVEIIQR